MELLNIVQWPETLSVGGAGRTHVGVTSQCGLQVEGLCSMISSFILGYMTAFTYSRLNKQTKSFSRNTEPELIGARQTRLHLDILV